MVDLRSPSARQAQHERGWLSGAGRWLALAPALLSACGGPTGEAPPGDKIACALDGAVEFADVCTAEVNAGEIVAHRPDGGFQRFAISPDRTIAVLDGADEAEVLAFDDGSVELRVKDDRYRLRPQAPPDAPRP